MKAILPILPAALLALAALGQGAFTRSQDDASGPGSRLEPVSSAVRRAIDEDPGRLLEHSLARLRRYRSLEARLRQRVDMFGRQFVGSGTYVQGPPGSYLMRLEIKFQVGPRLSTLQQISDGHTLWMYQQVMDSTDVWRIDLDRVLAACAHCPPKPGELPLSQTLVLGGLPRLLESIHEHFDFVGVQRQELSNLPVLVVRGQWKPDVLAELLKPQGGEGDKPDSGSIDFSRLEQPLPDEVRLVFGEQDLFPYRIEFIRRSPSDTVLPAHGEKMLVLELFDVRTDVSLDPNRFRYTPGLLDVVDRTNRFIKQLGLKAIDKKIRSGELPVIPN